LIPSGRVGSTIEATAEAIRISAMETAILAFAASLAFMPAIVLAQATTTTPTRTKPATINQRKENHQDRIAQGVKSGQLTAGEAAKLEHQESGINKEESGVGAQDNGKLTAKDRKTLTHQQNVESKRIYRDKHNARV
jgi:hypothetical protein